MGSTCCKSPFNPHIPDFGRMLLECPLKLCPTDTQITKDEAPARPRKFSSSDISGPLPLGTVISPPKRPPRKRKRRISRWHSCIQLYASQPLPDLLRSKSAVELSLTNFDGFIIETTVEPVVHLYPLILPVGSSEAIVTPPRKVKHYACQTPTIIITEPILTSSEAMPQVQQIISQNKRTFLASLLEDSNNNNTSVQSSTEVNRDSTSRRSSITDSLREFESSLYQMLSESVDDDPSEHSSNLQQLVTR